MASLPLVLAALTLLVVALSALEAVRGNRGIAFLRDLPPLTGREMRRVSVVIAARDEERNLEEALRSVLQLDYAPLEVVVVNDRSTDATGAILNRLAARDPRLRVLHLTELPPGWLGKNHALQSGADAASGELLLFTDADVVFEPTALSRAVGYLEDRALDHLAATPQILTTGALMDLIVGSFTVFFGQYSRPWKARDPHSRQHIGIGAFNLVRASAYRAVGGHQPIAMRPDDDMKLGKLLKQHRMRQDVVFGRGLIQVAWYATVRELLRGLEKNAFAGVDYSVPRVLGATIGLLLLHVWPLPALLLTSGVTRLLNLAILLLFAALYAHGARYSAVRPGLGIAFPLGSLAFLYMVWRSMLTTLVRGGITWRGTHYPLAALRANRV
jgi:glycosyltransferase involved in cell wall biosynthesis